MWEVIPIDLYIATPCKNCTSGNAILTSTLRQGCSEVWFILWNQCYILANFS